MAFSVDRSSGRRPRSGRSKSPPINMSELRVVLLGKNSLEISKVGNIILGRDAFDPEAPPPSVEQHSERAEGRVEGRYITLINTPHLFDPQLSAEELIDRLRECVSLCSPGPHAFLLVLQSGNVTKKDLDRITYVMKSFSPCSMEYAIVLITGKSHVFFLLGHNQPEKNKHLHQLIRECRGRFEKTTTFDKSQVPQLLKMIEKIVKDNRGYLICQISEPFRVHFKQGEHSAVFRRGQAHSTETAKPDGTRAGVCELRIVLLGKNSSDISRVGNFILDRDAFDPEAPPPSVEQHSERAGGTVEGRYITLINTPHLFDPQLSLVKLNQRVRECVSLCSPGPHVLVLVLQPDDFTDTDRHRLDHILSSLSEEPHKHTLVVTTQTLQSGSSIDSAEEEVYQRIIAQCSNRHLEFSSKRSRSDLVKMVEKMNKDNSGIYLKWDEYKDAQSKHSFIHYPFIKILKNFLLCLILLLSSRLQLQP